MLLLLTVLFQTFTEFGAFKHTTLRRFNGFVLDGSKDHQAPYFDALNEVMHDIKDRYFFPGHRGGEFAPSNMIRRYGKPIFDLDLPELDGLDNIHSPEGPLLDALELASRLFESYRTWFLVNGSTSGILAAILACARLHDRSRAKAGSNAVVIMGRDSHKSAFDALSIAGCDAALLPCTWDDNFGVTVGVEIESIEQALDEHGSNVCAVLLTRPTYQGILCSTQRLRDISALCHARGVPLIVDEAHGSHLRFLRGSGDFYPHARDALDCGADVVVQSAHKTLTALSQCAFLHIGKNAFSFPSSCISDVDVQNSVPELSQTEAAAEVLHECFSMLTTTSPNALLLASLDATRAQMAHSGYSMVSGTAAAVDELRNKLRRGGGGVQLLDDSQSFLKSKTIQRHGHGSSSTRVEEDENKANSRVWYVDPLRLTVRFPGRSALRVDDTMCEERGIFCELNLRDCITYGIPPGSNDSTLTQLTEALLEQARSSPSSPSSGPNISNSNTTAESAVSASASVAVGGNRMDIGYLNTSTLRGAQVEVISVHAQGGGSDACSGASALLGRISAETICVYPPGIPLVAKGEKISESVLQSLVSLSRAIRNNIDLDNESVDDQQQREGEELGSGCTVTGCADPTLQTIRVVKAKEKSNQ